MIKKTCCFAGHSKFKHRKEIVWCVLMHQIVTATENGYTHFIVGGVLGLGAMAADIVIKLRDKFGDKVTLELAIPYPLGLYQLQNEYRKKRFETFIKANKITAVCNEYRKDSFIERDKYMVDNSSLVIAYCNGQSGRNGSIIKIR